MRKDHLWQVREKGSPLAEERTGVTAGRIEDRSHWWQGRAQGSLLAEERAGVIAGRREGRGHHL